ncbi:MAG: response regulator transcription factor, partial [Pseudomonadota bacterium]|uniref:response regulator n=2 Tax=Pseudomonas sp. TaxID=306 RepID=UPI0027665424|nr:response regulator transcription factor [Pseudomonadota bacterium]MDP9213499.1 response regulator transcription factor [Pseudomonadota bacterium]MDP9450217.1 response regulator transcription factor [Pseudomonadota bacterium]
MYTALVVDDHPFIRSSVKMLLSQVQFEVVAEADNGADAVQLAREHVPDLIILDIGMPKLDGLEVLNRIASLRLPSKILVFTSQSALFYWCRTKYFDTSGTEKWEDQGLLEQVYQVSILTPVSETDLTERR